MPIYSTKAAFFAEGVESCPTPYEQLNCPICLEELESNNVLPASTELAVVNAPPNSLSSVTSVPYKQDTVVVNAVTTLSVTNPQTELRKDHTAIKVSCCNNVFSRHCLGLWLRRKNSCPFCRSELFPTNAPTHRLAAMIEAALERAVYRVVAQYLDEVRNNWEEGDGLILVSDGNVQDGGLDLDEGEDLWNDEL